MATIGLTQPPLRAARSALPLTPARYPAGDTSPTASATTVCLPWIGRHARPSLPHPDPEMAARMWSAARALQASRPLASVFPGYGAEDPPTDDPTYEALAWRNLDAACRDFPDLPDVFGAGVHHETCYFSVASYLGNYHAVAARIEASDADLNWSRAYLRLALREAAAFIEGAETAPVGGGYRDTLAAAWQNPMRAVDLVLLAEQMRQLAGLDEWSRARVADLAGGAARAWHAAFWLTGVHPSHGVILTIRTPPDVSATTPFLGIDVACRVPWAIAWDADGRNSPAEETAWMGAGAVLVSRALGSAMSDGAMLGAEGRHYVDYALALDRPDGVHGGTVRTLALGTSRGPYGGRPYWLKNHAADAPAIPYLAATWHYIGTALMGSPLGGQQPWPSLMADDAQWQVMLRATEESLLAPDGGGLIDWSPGGRIGYDLDAYPLWRTDCGQAADGRAYTRLVDGPTGAALDLSEIGHPAGLDLLAGGWVVRALAAMRGDASTYRQWTWRLERILDEYTARPPDPGWARCKFAPYVSANPAYHYARFLSSYAVAVLGESGFQVEPWSGSEDGG